MKERPIIFNTEMIKAILDDRKTQTRRVIKSQPTPELDRIEDYGEIMGGGWLPTSKSGKIGIFTPPRYKCPYGKIGDRLWVRETLRESSIGSDYSHVAGYAEALPTEPGNKSDLRFYPNASVRKDGKLVDWFDVVKRKRFDVKPRPVISSIFMPRWASRIDLEITDIRVERVQDISWEDLLFEGYKHEWYDNDNRRDFPTMTKMLEWFIPLWDSINVKRGYGWNENNWVWVIDFRRI